MIDPDVTLLRGDTALEILMSIFADQHVVVVQDGGQVTGILTQIDLLDFLAARLKGE